MSKNHLTNSNDEYQKNGVLLQPATPHAHSTAHLNYNGLLSQNGAADVYAHVGFDSKWTNAHDYKMNKTAHGFEANIPVQSHDTLNVAFKDCANHWDNNCGKNYTFDIDR